MFLGVPSLSREVVKQVAEGTHGSTCKQSQPVGCRCDGKLSQSAHSFQACTITSMQRQGIAASDLIWLLALPICPAGPSSVFVPGRLLSSGSQHQKHVGEPINAPAGSDAHWDAL